MDDWAKFFFKYFRISKELVDSLDVAERLQLRKNLHCKSFEWYLKTIWPDNFLPSATRFFGKILHVDETSPLFIEYQAIISDFNHAKSSNWTYVNLYLNERIPKFKKLVFRLPLFCLRQPQTQSELNMPFGQAMIAQCAKSMVMEEMFVITENGEVTTNDGVCLDALETIEPKKNATIARIVNCANSPRQRWIYDFRQQQIIQRDSKNCLTADEAESESDAKPKMNVEGETTKQDENRLSANVAPCANLNSQKWILLPLNWK